MEIAFTDQVGSTREHLQTLAFVKKELSRGIVEQCAGKYRWGYERLVRWKHSRGHYSRRASNPAGH
jgi:hypothetical protein